MPAAPSRFVLLTLAYALTGWLSLAVAVPPGYAAPVFPAAGLGLSALLIFGTRSWPAIFLGSLAVQAAILHGDQVTRPEALSSLAVALAVSLQAVLGAALARRLVGYPCLLDTPRSIVPFLTLVAPLSSLIAPCIAIPALYASGRLAAGELAFNGWIWWMGDTLGVLIMAPLMFALFGQPAEHWRSRRLGVAVPLAVALLLLGFGFRQLLLWESERVQAQFDRDARHLAGELEKRLGTQIDVLMSIERLIIASENVTPAEFQQFVQPWLRRQPDTINFTWRPLVPSVERADFEAAVRASGEPGFSIRSHSTTGHILRAGPAPEYLPALYVEPAADATRVLGIDALSLPATSRAVAETRATGLPIATEGLLLAEERASKTGIVVFLAVRAPQDDGTMRLRGVVASALRMDDVLSRLARESGRRNVDACLVEVGGADSSRRRLAGPTGCAADDWLAGPVGRSFPFEFAGREWSLDTRANEDYLAEMRSWGVWATAAVAPFAVGLLGAFLLVSTGQHRRIATLVEQRTRELAEAQRLARMGSWELAAGEDRLRRSAELDCLLALPAGQGLTLDDLTQRVVPRDRAALADALETVGHAPARISLDCRISDLPAHVLNFCIESEWSDARMVRLRGTVQDVTTAREAEEHIKYLARYDTLTGLPNRATWLEGAHAVLHAAQRHDDTMAVLFIDVDEFKAVNDTYGHDVGDTLLTTIAKRLSSCMREEDLLARLGGDEFVALLTRIERRRDAGAVAAKMLSVLSEPVEIGHRQLLPSVSVGIAFYPFDGTTIEQLLRSADAAMYLAKQAGRNAFRFRTEPPDLDALRTPERDEAAATPGDDGGLADEALKR
ncbi:diguanylate cyclase domain-containing protein [Thauera phenolivorans]|uniref:diguanylate cyclase domain-containing protein n=1 Tax=Thauera phenolivorans TaxID=1792543 RepID=UPI00083AF4EA|nr:diguanylate cyclase [Thauera phenolivorans]